jgi:branched-subunit amino acid aminotransferase/4-amino-4-deoxychorismate lyase
MSSFGDFYRFQANRFIPFEENPTNEVLLRVADSWLVENGKVRSLNAHLKRFEQWVLAEDPSMAQQLPVFFSEMKKMLPLEGRWFPRLEYHGEVDAPFRLFLRLREAPEKIETISLWTYPEPDPRLTPEIKGPDLSLCQQLRRHANMNGADEAVILNSEGYVAEGALSSLVWWRGDVLCSSNQETKWLESITRQEVFSIAEQLGLETRLESVKPEELAGLEIWALSSLNGIMPVRSWAEVNPEFSEPKHLNSFKKRLQMLATQLE